jgi:hypothetical protein
MDRLEGVLNYICPKSIILYGEKRAVESNLSKSTEASVSATAAAAA